MNEIPEGITFADVVQAIKDYDSGVPHKFADSTGYDLLHQGKRYPPKAVLGLAASLRTGREFGPYDFKGGEGSKCFRVLRGLGFSILVKDDTSLLPEEISEPESYFEGSVKQIVVNRYERDPDARKKCIEIHGAICRVCGFKFDTQYGQIGEGFIHVHHLKPLSEVNEGYLVDPIKDLIPVCPNCHAMIHRKTPPHSIEEMKDLMQLASAEMHQQQ